MRHLGECHARSINSHKLTFEQWDEDEWLRTGVWEIWANGLASTEGCGLQVSRSPSILLD